MIVHQTWGSTQVPEPYASYRAKLPWPTRLWTDEEMRSYVYDHYASDEGVFYDVLPLDVHRWDMFRYYLLYREGGMYLDMDMEPSTDDWSLLANRDSLVLCHEHPNDAVRFGVPSLVSNAMFIVPEGGHWFFGRLIAAIRKHPPRQLHRKAVCYDTGPGLVTRVWYEFARPGVALHHSAFYPYSVLHPDDSTGTYATHRFSSTWWSQCSDLKESK